MPDTDLIVVPMQYKLRGFHAGHISVLNRAKKAPKDSHILVVADLRLIDMQGYYGGLVEMPSVPPLDRMKEDCDKEGLELAYIDLLPVSVEDRDRIWKEANQFVKDLGSIVPPSEATRCALSIAHLAHPHMRRGVKHEIKLSGKKDIVVLKGPDFASFFIKKYGVPRSGKESGNRLNHISMGKVNMEITPTIARDSENGMKLQDATNDLERWQRDTLKRIPHMIKNIEDRLKPGDNQDIVNEIGISYKGRPWTLKSASLVEGGIVPGRLETYKFVFRDQRPKGTLIQIEEIRFYAKGI